MNALILFIIGIPAVEIYLLIKVGGVIGALNTILLIFFTAITGVYFAKLAGLSTLKSGSAPANPPNCISVLLDFLGISYPISNFINNPIVLTDAPIIIISIL